MTEFELYLVKPGQDRVMLDLAKCLSDYGTIKDHVSQFIVSQLVQLCTTFCYKVLLNKSLLHGEQCKHLLYCRKCTLYCIIIVHNIACS